MNKTQIKKLVSWQITAIQKASHTVSTGKWERAKAFTEIRDMIVWKKSPYLSFLDFCKEVFPDLNYDSIRMWIYTYQRIAKWYTWAQIQTINKSVGYSLVVNAFPHIQRKRTVKQFIALAKKNLPPPGSKYNTTVKSEARVLLYLTPKYMNKLEQLLVAYGYTIPATPSSRKNGISKAMSKYLDTI